MRLIERVAFDLMLKSGDGFGGKTKTPDEQFVTRATFTFLRGGEEVQAGRLVGKQVIVATVRRSYDALRVKRDWQMRDTRTGTAYNIRAIEPNRENPRQYLDFLCESSA
jgi:hypothetical protein